MIAVDLITEQELDKRFDTLSSKLKDVLTSERSLSVVNQICEKNKITDEEKILIIHQLVGLVILGLMHSYDLGAEINEALSLENPKFSNAIAEELNAKVFLPIKVELENNYHPINPIHPEKKSSLPEPTPVATKATTPPPKSITLSDIGWSKVPSAPSVAKPMAVPNAPTAAPLPIAPPTSKSTPGPAPMMLHQDTTFKPAEKNAGFTLSKPEGAAEMNMGRGTPQAPRRPAVLEFGKVPMPPAPPKSQTTEFKSSFASMPTTNTGPRNVSEIASPPPNPPAAPIPTTGVPVPPRAPQIPQPPKPSAPQNISMPQPNTPIIKDFL